MVRIAKKEGFTFKSVPLACEIPTINALLGGHTMMGGGTAAPYRSHVSANTIRIILSDEKVNYAAGQGSSFEDQHYNFEAPLLALILAPKGIPDGIRKTLEKAFNDGLKSEVFRRVVEDQELILKPLTGKALSDYLKKTNFTYEELIKESGMHKSQKK
jgi:tripartite-type tricarboxylate transporter receptor subunit TctC